MDDNTELKRGEIHPMAISALKYIESNRNTLNIEAMASCALSSNRCAEICWATYNRLLNNQPVSDRYILGLAWFIRELRDDF